MVMALEVKEVSVGVSVSDDTLKDCQLSKDSLVAEMETAIRSCNNEWVSHWP